MPKRKLPSFPIVGIGASAGGLEAVSRLLDLLPADTGMAFILIQHLDPAHESLMAELLSKHTKMTVMEAADGVAVAPNHVYVIPPGTYLAVNKDVIRLSKPLARHGARLPFDFLMTSLADGYGARAIGVVLSGTGADGSIGLKAVHDCGGLVIAQDPAEADYGGMPRSAIDGEMVDRVLPLAAIAAALAAHDQVSPKVPLASDDLTLIIDLLRQATTHDFRLYKMGTLTRRIERRMALASIKRGDMAGYLEILRKDPAELDLLAKDLLINVTSFFRDPSVFEKLSAKIIPEMIANHSVDQPLRIWIAGCSTGEEAYSLTILLREAIIAAQSNIKLQVFASDVDGDAVACARDGVYPLTIATDVAPERLARFFIKEDHGYRVSPDLRATVVFTVQDVLSDPPFSRLDMVSCRNLLIYLGPEAQGKVVSLFHFALRKGGILLLGNAETIGVSEGRFEVVSKAERIYRHTGNARTGEMGFAMGVGEIAKPQTRADQGLAMRKQSALADLVQRLVMESHAPAAVLINRKFEYLYALGPTDRYLKLAKGHASHDLLGMAPQALRTRLRLAVQNVTTECPSVITPGGKTATGPFNLSVQLVKGEDEERLLICFIDAPTRESKQSDAKNPKDGSRISDLEQELEATRTELQGAIHNLEISGEEQRAINEEALSVNEEFQSTNEELLTSKEELQSLNEELTALNSQLQETLERQRTTSNDLQNVLYSTNVATLFLDPNFNIRFFTPATKALFNVIPGDIGRPLADLRSLATDTELTDDARAVLSDLQPADREIQTGDGLWFIRRIRPYRADDDGIEGVVITFSDITERKHAAKLVDDAKKEAELATVAKSRFLAVASHDLRQPLQTLALLQGLLAKRVEGEKAQELVGRLDETLGAMTGMLNTLLDINQIDAGTVQPVISRFSLKNLFAELQDEYSYHARAKRLTLKVIHSNSVVDTDKRLLEQMLRNLISNALKYTKRGKIVLGVRHLADRIRIEIHDTGIGIAPTELQAIFDEYHQVNNAARERSRGLGLGLSIVQRLGQLLGHQVDVRSALGKGSVFSIEIMLSHGDAAPVTKTTDLPVTHIDQRTASILIVDDDPEVRALLELLLNDEGHITQVAADGPSALALVDGAQFAPDLILTDYNLPNGMDGLRLAAKLRNKLGAALPVIILTGDISTDTMKDVGGQQCVQLNKPVKAVELSAMIQRLLAGTEQTAR